MPGLLKSHHEKSTFSRTKLIIHGRILILFRAWPRRTEVPVFGGESLTAGPGWRIGTSPLWLQIIGTEQSLCLPFWSLHHCGGKRGTGSEKKAADMQSTDLCVLPILMKPLRTPKSEDTINEYCYEHFKGDFECTLAEGKGRRHCWIASLSEVSWAMEQQSQANCQKETSSSYLESSRIMIAKKAIAQGELLFQELFGMPKRCHNNSQQFGSLWSLVVHARYVRHVHNIHTYHTWTSLWVRCDSVIALDAWIDNC